MAKELRATSRAAPPPARSDLVPTEHLCAARLVPIEHVGALMLASQLAPAEVAPDGAELVAPDYLRPDPDPPPVYSTGCVCT